MNDAVKNQCASWLTNNQFIDNTYKNCHKAKEGAIFHLTNGAVVNIKGDDTFADNNSAYYGGFAYLSGEKTRLLIKRQKFTLNA